MALKAVELLMPISLEDRFPLPDTELRIGFIFSLRNEE
jgi:hypothetical protein